MERGDYFIDISVYQSSNAAAYASESRNTLIKSTEGTGYVNPYASSQASTSNPIGFYHFARFGGNTSQALVEANFFLGNIPKKVKYLALDYEDSASGNVQANTNAILAFMDRVSQAGYTPILYTYTPYLGGKMYADQIIKRYPKSLWIASYVTTAPNSTYGAGDSGNLARNSANNGVGYAQEHYRWHQFADNTNTAPLDKNFVLINDGVSGVDNTIKETGADNMFVYRASEDMAKISKDYEPFKKGAMFLFDLSKRKVQYIGTAEQADTLTNPYFAGLKVKEEGAVWFVAMLQRMANLPK